VAKLFTVYALYGASLVSFGVGGYMMFDYQSRRSELEADVARGCDAAIGECANQEQRDKDLRSQQSVRTLMLGGGSLTLLAGLATARLWQNENVAVAVAPSRLDVRWSF
jgi:hypothetical protein